MIHVFALLQYFKATLSGAEEDAEVGYYSLVVQADGVCLDFDKKKLTFTWPQLEAAFRENHLTALLGLKFDALPDIFGQIPPFQGLCERSYQPLQERYYSGGI
jgi:hypothetical protein